MPEGTGREIGSEEVGKTMRIFSEAVPKEIQRIPIKRRKLFCSWEQGEELGAEIIRGCQKGNHRRLFEHIPIIQLHTFLRKDKRQIQRIKTSRILGSLPRPASDLRCARERKERKRRPIRQGREEWRSVSSSRSTPHSAISSMTGKSMRYMRQSMTQ